MKKDLYESRKMYQNPIVLVITIVCAMILIIFIADFVSKKIAAVKIDNDTKSVLKLVMEYNGEDKLDYAKREFEKIGYSNANINLVELDDYILLTNNASYFTIVGELFKKPKYHRANFKASFNDYHEIVIEEYSEDNMKENDFNNDGEIIIK